MTINPYQSPAILDEASFEPDASTQDCWRDDDQMVVTTASQLPGRCLFCSNAVDDLTGKKLFVYPPIRYEMLVIFGIGVALVVLLIASIWPSQINPFFGYLVLVVIALATVAASRAKQSSYAKLEKGFPICRRHRWQRTVRILVWTLVCSVYVLQGFDLIPNVRYSRYWIYGALFTSIIFSSSSLTATKHISGRFWIRGCSDKFLQRLPNWDQK